MQLETNPVILPAVDLQPYEASSHDATLPPPSASTKGDSPFRYLDLPIELRLKIYRYLLPPRIHRIVTQIPHNGFFYHPGTLPAYSAQSFYPYNNTPQNLTTYKILNENWSESFPAESIYPEILRVSKTVREEAEGILYGGSGVVFDFGTHLDAAIAFFNDRSRMSRESVRHIKINRTISELGKDDGTSPTWEQDGNWNRFCRFANEELVCLRELDMTVGSLSSVISSFPLLSPWEERNGGDWFADKNRPEDDIKEWRGWERISEGLKLEALRKSKVTWLGTGGLRTTANNRARGRNLSVEGNVVEVKMVLRSGS
jgi:hypothetical protein